MYGKSVIIHKNRIFPYFQDEDKKSKQRNIIIIIKKNDNNNNKKKNNKKMNKKKRYILLTKILVLFSINLAYIRGKLSYCKAKTGRIALTQNVKNTADKKILRHHIQD